MTPADFARAAEATAAALAPLALCSEELHIHTPTPAAIEVARGLPGATFTRYGAARTCTTGCLVVTVGRIKVTLHGVPVTAAPPKLTKPQLAALKILGDGKPHEGAPHTAHGWVGGAVVKALISHGYAQRVLGSFPTTYVITAAGTARLAQETP